MFPYHALSVDEDAFTRHLVSVLSFDRGCLELHGNNASLQNSTRTMTGTKRPAQALMHQ